MSIAALYQVFDETRRLAIAGSSLAADDFRLKKLVPVLEKSGEKAPVFTKVAQSVERLLGATAKESAAALLDLSSLVMAILYTQGELGGSGKIKPIASVGISQTKTQTPARLLKPVIEALGRTGSGRLEMLREALGQGVFQDPRLVNHAITGLDDKFSEVADLMEKIVGDYGPSILPLIQDKIEIKGKSGDARRLRILYRLAPQSARPLVLDAFESGSKELKLAAIACLVDDPTDLDLLMQQAASKQRSVREATYPRLAKFDRPEVNELLVARLADQESWQVATAIRESNNRGLADRVLAHLEEAIARLEPWIGKKKLTPADKTVLDQSINHFRCGWSCFANQSSTSLQKFASGILARWDDLLPLRGKYSGGSDLLEAVIDWCLEHGTPAQIRQIADHHQDDADGLIEPCLRAVFMGYPPAKTYDELSPLYHQFAGGKAKQKQAKTGKTAEVKRQLEKFEQLQQMIGKLGDESLLGDWVWDEDGGRGRQNQKKKGVALDPRWIDDFVQSGDVELLVHSVGEKDTQALEFLAEHVRQTSGKEDDAFADQLTTYKLVLCRYKRRMELLTMLIGRLSEQRVRKMKRKGYHYFGSTYWLGRSLQKLTAKECGEMTEALAGAEESLIDELLPHLR